MSAPDPWTGPVTYQWLQSKTQVRFSYLVDMIESLTLTAKSKIARIRSQKSAMSIADMFDLQMAMNKLSQFSELSTSIISAMNTSINSMARNIKG
jgi:hypothetical protein